MTLVCPVSLVVFAESTTLSRISLESAIWSVKAFLGLVKGSIGDERVDNCNSLASFEWTSETVLLLLSSPWLPSLE